MGAMALSLLVNHQQFIYGIIIGAIISNPGICAVAVFNGFVRVPGVGAWIAKNPDKAKAWADGFDKAIDDCIEKYAKEHTPPSA